MNIQEQKTILLVEDEVLIAMAEAMNIERFGYQVITANSGEKAVEVAVSNEKISLILMDIDLGRGIDGPEAAKQILAKRNIPIVFLTSHSEKEYVDRVKEITRYGYVLKGCGDFVLRSSIEMAFELFEANRKLKENMEALRYERDRAQGYLDTVETIIVALDTKGRITTINRKGCKLFGVGEDELIGQSWFSTCLPQPDGLENVFPAFLKLINGEIEATEYFENPIVTRSGELRQIAWHNALLRDDQGCIIGTLSSGEDITERKQAEEKLITSEQKYRELFDFLPIPVYEMDLETNITSANRATYETFRGTEEDLKKGIKVWQLVSPEGLERSAKNIERLLKGKPVEGTDYTLMRLDGSVFPAIVISRVIYSNGKPVGLRGAIVDITERKQAEEKIQASLREKEIL